MLIKPFLKWPGNKYKIIDKIIKHLPKGKCLIEPFVGSSAVFLNTDYDKYILNDINPDLINVYLTLQKYGEKFIGDCQKMFKYNTEKEYYGLREEFNKTKSVYRKSCIFVYLNRHCFNGLCRYNLSSKFNVPYGFYRSPYFPLKEMRAFYEKTQNKKVIFSCLDFSSVMKKAKKGEVVYCDPPYIPLNKTASFTNYHSGKFLEDEHLKLAALSESVSNKGVSVLISNHFSKLSKSLYSNAKLYKFYVQRYISCKSNRKKVQEVLAVFS